MTSTNQHETSITYSHDNAGCNQKYERAGLHTCSENASERIERNKSRAPTSNVTNETGADKNLRMDWERHSCHRAPCWKANETDTNKWVTNFDYLQTV